MQLYTDSVGIVCYHMFTQSGQPESLPPTSDALQFHLMRVHYQALIWRYFHCSKPNLLSPDSMGWERTTAGLQLKLISLSPILDAYLEIISCSCCAQCRSFHCKCRKADMACTTCGCRKQGESTCINNL